MKKFLLLSFLILSTLAAQADLKTWLHGAPPAAKPGPPDATAASVAFAPGVTPDKQIMDFLVAFAEAMRIHDGTALKPRLSEKYAIENMPAEHNAADFFTQAIVMMKSANELVVTSIEPAGEVRVAKVEFRSASRPAKTRTFRFDPAGKLLSADFFSLERHGFF
jgi:hypothetical protein